MADTQEDAEARLIDEIETGRVDEIGHFLLEHLADWGPGNLDVGQLARRVFERIEQDGE
jgi:hypothetical protein